MKKLLALIALCALVSACGKKEPQQVVVDNFTDGERITYPVPLFRGHCDSNVVEVTVSNKTTGVSLKCPAYKGRFKGWTRLKLGVNEITISAAGATGTIKLKYERPKTDYLYQAYYLVDSTGDRKYLSNLENDPQEEDPDLWLKKYRTSLELLQSYSADSMVRNGFKRKTFSFYLDKDGEIDVQIITSKYTRAEINEWRRLNGDFNEDKLYEEFLRAVGKGNEGKGSRHITGLCNTQMIRDGRLSGNTALGGTMLGQFGANGLYGWPSSLSDVVQAFTNNTPITSPNNDSIGRNVQWGHISTTLGAYQHELGHSFGLPHIEGPGIMARAGDHINRIFTFFETPHAYCPTNYYFSEEQEECWNKPETAWLNVSPFFNEVKGLVSEEGPTITLSEDRETINIEAKNGLVWYTITDPFFVLSYDQTHYYPAPYETKEAKINIFEALKLYNRGMVQIDAIDAFGNYATVNLTAPIPEVNSRKYDFNDFELGSVKDQQGLMPLDSDTQGEIVEDPEEGRVLWSHHGGSGVMAPMALKPDEKDAKILEFRVRVKPCLGTCYFDLKDISGESLFYAFITEEGKMQLNSGEKVSYPKAKITEEWQDWIFVINLQKKALTRVIIEGKAYVLSNFLVGGNGYCECMWLKDVGEKGSYFKMCSGMYPKR
jgi:hypothetical protein